MPARERRSDSPRETRERGTKEEKGSKTDKGRKEEGEGFKTTSVLNTHPVSPGNTRPYSKDDRELM